MGCFCLVYVLYMIHTNTMTWLIDGSRSKEDDCMHPPMLNPERVLGGRTPQCTKQTHALERRSVATMGLAIQCNVCLLIATCGQMSRMRTHSRVDSHTRCYFLFSD